MFVLYKKCDHLVQMVGHSIDDSHLNRLKNVFEDLQDEYIVRHYELYTYYSNWKRTNRISPINMVHTDDNNMPDELSEIIGVANHLIEDYNKSITDKLEEEWKRVFIKFCEDSEIAPSYFEDIHGKYHLDRFYFYIAEVEEL